MRKNFSFTVEVAGVDFDNDFIDKLHEVECDDALLAVLSNKKYLDFDREDINYESAVSVALVNLQKTGAKIIGVVRNFD